MNAYEKINWQDADSTATPLDAENLNHMDNQLEALTDGKADKLPQGSNGVFLEAYNQGMRRTDYTATASASQVTSSATNKLLTAAVADEVFAKRTDLQELEYLSDKVQEIPSGNQVASGNVKYPSVNAVKGYVDDEFAKFNAVTENPNLFTLEEQTVNGVKVTVDGGGLYTFDGDDVTTTRLNPFVLPAGTYTAKIAEQGQTTTPQVAIRYGAGDGTTWLNANTTGAAAVGVTKTFAADTIVFLRLNAGTYDGRQLKITITKNDYTTAVDSVARDTAGFTQEQLKILNGKYSAQENAFYPLAEPDAFTWKNSPLHGKILTDFHGNYQVDFDVASCRNPIGKAYYVAPDGSDSNDGTPGAPFASISKAYTEGANTIYVYPGIYNRSTSIFNTAINRDLNIIGLGDGVILCTRVTNIPNSSEYGSSGSGVWACSSNSTTYLSNVVDIKNLTADGHYTKYTKLTTKEAVQTTAGSWALVNNVAYIHTLDGSNPLAGDDVLLLNSANPAYIFHITDEVHQTGKDVLTTYPLIKVTGGNVYLENLTCLEGSAPLSVEKQQDGSNIEIYGKNCKFFYSRSALSTKHNADGSTKYDTEGNVVTELIENDVCMLYGTTLSIFQNCEASFGLKDGFGYHMGSNSSTPPKAIEINCIGINNGNIEDGNDQGSTMHNGGSIIRVRDICAQNYGANYADAHSGTESWNIGCVGFESLCDYSNIQISDAQNSNFLASNNAKMFCEGCVGFGSLHNVNATGGGSIYLRFMTENAANKVTSLSSDSTNTQYPSAKVVYDGLNTKEDTSNKTTVVNDQSTNNQYPTAKAVYEAIQAAIESLTN